jgi:hypothetical protein
MNNDPDCDRPQAHECPGPGCTYPLRAPAARVDPAEDVAFRLASHAMAFAASEDQFARFREFVIRAELERGMPGTSAVMREILDPVLTGQAHLVLLHAIQRLDPVRYH